MAGAYSCSSCFFHGWEELFCSLAVDLPCQFRYHLYPVEDIFQVLSVSLRECVVETIVVCWPSQWMATRVRHSFLMLSHGTLTVSPLDAYWKFSWLGSNSLHSWGVKGIFSGSLRLACTARPLVKSYMHMLGMCFQDNNKSVKSPGLLGLRLNFSKTTCP